jgi:hypothetical protein
VFLDLWIERSKNRRLEAIRDFIKREEDLAYVTGLKSYKISERFVDKIIDIIQKYETEEPKMLFRCTFLVLNDVESKNPLNTKTVK